MNGEHFIPFRRSAIVSMCADELPAEERESFLTFARMLASLLHHRFRARIEALKDAYEPFDRQADTRSTVTLSPDERRAAQARLEQELADLATAANFTPIEPAELERALAEQSLLKVKLAVDFDVIDKIMFFRRGESIRTRDVPIWHGLRRRSVTFTNYARVLVYARFKDAEHLDSAHPERLPFRPGSVVIKLFQNVPRDDMEMVLPNVKVRMRGVDKLLIGVPAVISGVAVVVTKVIASIGLLLLLVAFWLGLRDQPVTLDQAALVSVSAGVIALGGYVVRQVTKFKNRKILFMKALSENLYFRNLDNDAGVFHHLLDAAEEAEVKEAVLAYHFLRTSPGPLTAAELDHQIEDWFAQRWETHLDYEVADGLGKLRRLRLVTEDEQGRISAIGLADARRRIDQIWDSLFDEGPRQGGTA